jgi:hypothetical protein
MTQFRDVLAISFMLLSAISCVSKSNETSNADQHCKKSPALGTWKLASDDTLITFKEDCTGVAVGCGSEFRFGSTRENSGSTQIEILGNPQSENCLPKGVHKCTYSFNGDSASVNCNGALLNLKKQ